MVSLAQSSFCTTPPKNYLLAPQSNAAIHSAQHRQKIVYSAPQSNAVIHSAQHRQKLFTLYHKATWSFILHNKGTKLFSLCNNARTLLLCTSEKPHDSFCKQNNNDINSAQEAKQQKDSICLAKGIRGSNLGLPTRMVYLYYIPCLRYTILVGKPRNLTVESYHCLNKKSKCSNDLYSPYLQDISGATFLTLSTITQVWTTSCHFSTESLHNFWLSCEPVNLSGGQDNSSWNNTEKFICA